MLTARLRLLVCVVFAVAATAQAEPKTPVPSRDRPNVLFIVCDDLNSHVSTSGYRPIRTPALERLAAAGTCFPRAYCQYPVCNPSRSSFLTGLYPETTTVLDNNTDIRNARPNTVSLPQLFKQGGYWSAGVGKVFHGHMNHGEQAWHEYHTFANDSNPVTERARQVFEAEHGSIEKPANRKPWREKKKSLRQQRGGQTPPGYGPTNMTDAQHRDGKNVRQIAKWLDAKAYGDKPFFIACGVHKPHVPFWAPQKYFDMYPKPGLKIETVPARDWDDIPELAKHVRYKAFGFQFGQENDALARDYVQAYHACVSFIDAQLNLLLDALQHNGLWDNTIIVFTSDHGYHLGEHFMWGKVTLFEECARVPLIVRVPGRSKPGSTASGLVEMVDFMPTLAELCGIRIPDDVQGQSFASLIDAPSKPGKDVAYTVVLRGKRLGQSIRTARYRYAEWGNPDACEMYDLEQDPRELTNLATSPTYQQQVKQMHTLLDNARQRATRRD